MHSQDAHLLRLVEELGEEAAHPADVDVHGLEALGEVGRMREALEDSEGLAGLNRLDDAQGAAGATEGRHAASAGGFDLNHARLAAGPLDVNPVGHLDEELFEGADRREVRGHVRLEDELCGGRRWSGG